MHIENNRGIKKYIIPTYLVLHIIINYNILIIIKPFYNNRYKIPIIIRCSLKDNIILELVRITMSLNVFFE